MLNVTSISSAPLNYPASKNKTQHHDAHIESSFAEQVTQTRNAIEPSNKRGQAQNLTNHPLPILVDQKYDQADADFVKRKLSLLASFAINQYETLANIETQQAKSSLFGFSDYA